MIQAQARPGLAPYGHAEFDSFHIVSDGEQFVADVVGQSRRDKRGCA